MHPWDDNVITAHTASIGRGADVLANAYTITAHISLKNEEAAWWLCHKLVIELPLLPANAACDPSCDRAPKNRDRKGTN